MSKTVRLMDVAKLAGVGVGFFLLSLPISVFFVRLANLTLYIREGLFYPSLKLLC